MPINTLSYNGSMALMPLLKRRGAISLTPLIDVVFILLMFFMLTTSFVQERQLELSSPTASTSEMTVPPQIIWLDSSGNLGMESPGAPPLSDSSLKNLIDRNHPAVIRPAEKANIQGIVTALARLKRLGIDELSLGRPYGESE